LPTTVAPVESPNICLAVSAHDGLVPSLRLGAVEEASGDEC
jgi:hypothetical protein